MLHYIRETPRLGITIIATDNVERLQQNPESDEIDQYKIQWPDEKRIPTKVTNRSVEQHPSRDIGDQIDDGRKPLLRGNRSKPATPARLHGLRRIFRFLPSRLLRQTLDQKIVSRLRS